MKNLKLLQSYKKDFKGDDKDLEVLRIMKKRMKEKWLSK